MQLTPEDRETILDALFAYGMSHREAAANAATDGPVRLNLQEADKAQNLFLSLTDAKEFHFSPASP